MENGPSSEGEGSLSNSSNIARLAHQAVAGDNSAYQDLFDGFREHLKQFVDLRMDARLRRRIDPSDVIQETQIVALRRLPDFIDRKPMPFRIWIRKMAHEQLLNLHKRHVRTQRRSVRREVAFSERSSMLLANHLAAKGTSVSEPMNVREQRNVLAKAISLLNDSDREVLLMRFIEGLSYIEIGYSLEINEAAARKRSGRALSRLRERMKELGLEDTQ